MTLLSSFGTLVGLGGAPLLTIRMGEKNLKGARQILANCFLLLLVLAGVLTGLFLLIKRPLLLWFGGERRHPALCRHVSDHLHGGDIFCPAGGGA